MIRIKNFKYLKNWDVNYLYGWAMSQKLPLNKFEWMEDTCKFSENFIKIYDEESDERYFVVVNIQYPKKWLQLHNDLSFLTERMKTEKVEKLVTNLHDKTENPIYIRNLKQVLNHGLILKKVQNLIKKLG